MLKTNNFNEGLLRYAKIWNRDTNKTKIIDLLEYQNSFRFVRFNLKGDNVLFWCDSEYSDYIGNIIACSDNKEELKNYGSK